VPSYLDVESADPLAMPLRRIRLPTHAIANVDAPSAVEALEHRPAWRLRPPPGKPVVSARGGENQRDQSVGAAMAAKQQNGEIVPPVCGSVCSLRHHGGARPIVGLACTARLPLHRTAVPAAAGCAAAALGRSDAPTSIPGMRSRRRSGLLPLESAHGPSGVCEDVFSPRSFHHPSSTLMHGFCHKPLTLIPLGHCTSNAHGVMV